MKPGCFGRLGGRRYEGLIPALVVAFWPHSVLPEDTRPADWDGLQAFGWELHFHVQL